MTPVLQIHSSLQIWFPWQNPPLFQGMDHPRVTHVAAPCTQPPPLGYRRNGARNLGGGSEFNGGWKIGDRCFSNFPKSGCIFRLNIIETCLFSGGLRYRYLRLFLGGTEIKVLAPLITWQAQGQPAVSLSGWQDMHGEFVYKIVCFHLRWVHDWKHRNNRTP